MSKEMIISSSAHETRVAILEDDQVAEIFIERERSRGVVGNVYKGRVSKVLPGMQSAFIDLGLERDGFLYVSDVVSTTDQFDQLEATDGEAPVAADVVQPSSEEPSAEVIAAGLSVDEALPVEDGPDDGDDEEDEDDVDGDAEAAAGAPAPATLPPLAGSSSSVSSRSNSSKVATTSAT